MSDRLSDREAYLARRIDSVPLEALARLLTEMAASGKVDGGIYEDFGRVSVHTVGPLCLKWEKSWRDSLRRAFGLTPTEQGV